MFEYARTILNNVFCKLGGGGGSEKIKEPIWNLVIQNLKNNNHLCPSPGIPWGFFIPSSIYAYILSLSFSSHLLWSSSLTRKGYPGQQSQLPTFGGEVQQQHLPPWLHDHAGGLAAAGSAVLGTYCLGCLASLLCLCFLVMAYSNPQQFLILVSNKSFL